MNTKITWEKLTSTMQERLLEIHKMEYCIEHPLWAYKLDSTLLALSKRNLIVQDDRNTISLTEHGLRLIPQEKITWPIYKVSKQS